MIRESDFQIEQLKIASLLLENAVHMGLHDVMKWVSIEEAQYYLDRERWIAFQATDETGKPFGVGAIGIEEEGRLWIELLVVSGKKRRMGVASSLINKMIDWGTENEFRALFVDVDDDNHPAIKFYKALGFENAGRIFEYYYDSSAATIMIKRL
ncbi:MAG: GNAT family N-acetyltransferase [Candidatus Thorarchaeota archaeon]|jgi:ribosomal protein S18 acetylase RimI-like enzyme